MSAHQASIFCYSLLALFFAWVTLFGAWRSYRASALQERIETLLEHLHDLIRSGRVAAASPAVQRLTVLLESAASQTGMMTYTRFLLASAAVRWRVLRLRPEPAWGDCAELVKIREQMRILIARHVISGCPLLWILLPTAIAAVFQARAFAAEWPTSAKLLRGVVIDAVLLPTDYYD